MARSQAQTAAAVQRARPDPDKGKRVWHSGIKPKATTAAEVVASTSSTAASPSGAATAQSQRGWGELPAAERASRCAQLQEMGFSASAAQTALAECAWDVNKALDTLFNGRSTVNLVNTERPQTVTDGTQMMSQHTGARTQKAHNQAKACSMDASITGDSTSASGASTPRVPAWMSPQRDISCASSATDSRPAQEKSTSLPPGLEAISPSTLLAAPPGLLDEPTPCAYIPEGLQQTSTPVFQVPAIVVPVSGRSPCDGAVSVVPKRSLQKVQHTWQCEEHCLATQMSVEAETFVYVWSDSTTQSGWIYAESLICCNRAGWLPESMLQPLAPGTRWMRVTTACRATQSMQLQVEAGNMILVDIAQDPVNGWIYAEQVGSATGRPSLQGLIGVGGWVPIQCVKWVEV